MVNINSSRESHFWQIHAGNESTCGVTTNGNLYCWGGNSGGQLGNGEITHAPVPVPQQVGLDRGWATVSTLFSHSCAVTMDGDGYCWGANGGRLGNGDAATPPSSSVPIPVVGDIVFRSVSVGNLHTCGVSRDGSPLCWGQINDFGQLGNGSVSQDPTPSPGQVAGDLSFRVISSGFLSSCGLTPAGDAYCWGLNGSGQLGNGTITNSPTTVPTKVAGPHRFISISVGSFHACGVTVDRSAYCWGTGSLGRLGNGDLLTDAVGLPVRVIADVAFSDVSAGGAFSCGLTVSGEAYCWGFNNIGQLGNGSTTTSAVPFAVAGGIRFRTISAGGAHACGVAIGGSGYCWGLNNVGQLGNGTTATSLVPVLVAMPDSPMSNVSSYEVEALGSLGRDGNAGAWAVNSRGWIVGETANEQGFTRPFLWRDGNISDLGTLGGNTGGAAAINEHGDVAGYAETEGGATHAFLWRDGVMKDLGTLGGASSRAYGINNRGQVVGLSTTATGVTRAFVWDEGGMIELQTTVPTGTSSAFAINDVGQIAGTAQIGTSGRAVLWDDGVMLDLGIDGQAYSINNAGVIAGRGTVPGKGFRAFVWEGGLLSILPSLGEPFREAMASGINDRGQVVGESGTIAGLTHAFLWDSGVSIDLGTSASLQSSMGRAINDAGLVVGEGAFPGTSLVWRPRSAR